jgi:hypothetical protein
MVSIEDQLRGQPEPVGQMFRQILAAATDLGQVDVEVIAKGVVLHGSRRIFAGLVPSRRGLGGMLNLLAPRTDDRFIKVEQLTKRIWWHSFLLTDVHHVDDAFIGWVGEAWQVGQGAASPLRKGGQSGA